MLLILRAATELLAGRPLATSSTRPLPTAAAAAVQQIRGYSGRNRIYKQLDKHFKQAQPFSVAMKQLEEVVTAAALPKDALEVNRRALATLKEYVRSLENPQGYPPASIKNVEFVFRDPYTTQGNLERVRCKLKTTGGYCPGAVQSSLGPLLLRLGLPPTFYFDGDQFQPKAPPPPRVVPKPQTSAAPTAPLKPQEVEAVRARAAAAGFPSQTITEQQFKELEVQSEASRGAKAKVDAEMQEVIAKLKKIDPLLAAVAAVPWLATLPDDDSRDRVQMIKTKVLDEMESLGWDVRGPIRRLWQGERNLTTLQQGKDTGSQLAIKNILYYAQQNDKKYGQKTYES